MQIFWVISDRFARAFYRSGATRAVTFNISKVLDRVWHAFFFKRNVRSDKDFQVRYLALFLLSSVIHGFKWFWMKSLHKNIQLMLEFHKSPFLVLHFLLYLNDLPDDVICNIAIYADDITLYSKCDQASDLWQQLELASQLESDVQDTVDWARKTLLISRLEKLNSFWLTSLILLVLVIWKWMGLFHEEKKSFKMFGLTFSSKLYWGSYISPIAKTDSKKTWVLICSMKFLSLGVALYLYKSTIQPCMKYCCNVWADAPSCYLDLLDKLQKWICRTVCPSLAASLKPLAHPWNVGSLSLNYKYYFLRCPSELAQLVPLPYSRGKSNCYFDRLHDFSSPFLDVTRMPISTGSFLAQLDSGILCL